MIVCTVGSFMWTFLTGVVCGGGILIAGWTYLKYKK
jgi:hypothetical protein